MCGITGIVDFENIFEKKEIFPMVEKIKHRGPDEIKISYNIYKDVAVCFANTRLSIIDIENGSQPFYSDDGTIQLIQNGEIYNFREQKNILINLGYSFKTNSDTEVLLKMYEYYGESFVNYVDGMFAVAIWDCNINSLIIATDRYGKKPLYYYLKDKKFFFSSELNSLVSHFEIKKSINYNSISEYLNFLFISAPSTIYKNIFRGNPSELIIYNGNQLVKKKYWKKKSIINKKISIDEAIIKIDHLFTKAVEKRLIADVKVGAFLSGGIDSSAVVAYMSLLSKNPIDTFSVGFEDSNFNELPFAKIVAKKYGTIHHEIVVKSNIEEDFSKIVNIYSEPFADSSAIPSYYLCRFAKQNIKVALNGDGGDELFAGYGHHKAWKLSQILLHVPKKIRNNFLGLSIFKYKKNFNRSHFLSRIKRFLENSNKDIHQQYQSWHSIFSKDLKEYLFYEKIKNFDEINSLVNELNDENSLEKCLSKDINWLLPNDFLVKMDRASMHNSLELRSPFLDKDLSNFVFTLPENFKMNLFRGKYILKKTLKDKLPKNILYRKKHGFTVPIGNWIRKELKLMVESYLFDGKLKKRELFKEDKLKEIYNLHKNNKKDYSHQLWTVFVLEQWFRNNE